MKLVEAEAEGPIEGEAAVVTPPRPPHRRVSISLLFTLTVLTGTVVAIYMVFPARHNVLLTEAIERHEQPQAWDLASPPPGVLRAWTIGILGTESLLPSLPPLGVRRIEVLKRPAALMRVAVGGDEVTYLVQRSRGIIPAYSAREEGELLAIAWKRGKFSCVVVGPKATASTWRSAFSAP